MVVRDKGTAKYQDACHTPLIYLSSLKTYSGLKTNSLTYKRSQNNISPNPTGRSEWRNIE